MESPILFKDKFVSADTYQSPQIHLDLEQTVTKYYSFPTRRSSDLLNKIGDSNGELSLSYFRFLDSLWPFAPIAFFFWFVNFWVSRIPWDTFWVTNPIWIVLGFEIFFMFSGISALWLLTVCGKSEYPHLAYIVQCGKYAVCSWLDCGNLMFTHCVQGLLAESS